MADPLTFRLGTRHWRLGAALLSGVLQYLATGLEPWWWAAWLAPIPLLVAAFRASTREAWALAVMAGVIGGASMAGFYAIFIGPIGTGLVMLLRGLPRARAPLRRARGRGAPRAGVGLRSGCALACPHGHPAGAESGFTVIRSARQGLLTVSDRYGRIVDVTGSRSAPVATLAVLAPLGSGEPTVYARLGDGFGWLCAIASAAAWVVSLRSRRSGRASGRSRSQVAKVEGVV